MADHVDVPMQTACLSIKDVGNVGQDAGRHGWQLRNLIEEFFVEAVVFVVVLVIILWCLHYYPVRRKEEDVKPTERNHQQGCGLDCATAFQSNVENFADLTDLAGLAAQQRAASARRSANNSEKTALSDIMKQYAENGKLDEMAQLFEEVEKRFRPFLSMVDYHTVIVFLARGGDPTTAHKWVRRCTELGLNPKEGTYNTVIHSYAKKASVTNAMEVLKEMEHAGLECNTVTYNGVMDAWAHVGDAGKAQEWMKNMLEVGLNPNIYSFSIVLRACATAGLQEDLDMWFEYSEQLGFELNLATFDSVVRALARRGDAESSIKWLAAMSKRNAKPSIYCCMEVLTPIVKANNVELADRLMDCMRAVDLPPDSAFYSRAVHMAAQSGHGDKAQRWADDCAKNNGRLSWAARQAMTEASLTIPKIGKVRKEVSADGDVELSCGAFDAGETTDNNNTKVQQMTSEEAKQAARAAAIGKRFSGTVKDFVPGQFGYITCPALHDLFRRDVFLGRHDNPEMLTKGQRVSFTLRVDSHVDRPRAADVFVLRPSASR